MPFPRIEVKDRQIVVGMRPQSLSLTPQSSRKDNAPIAARVEVREMMGSEAYLHLTSTVGALVLRTDAHTAPREGETVSVYVDTQKLHVFDRKSGARL